MKRERAEHVFLLVSIAILSILAFLLFRPFIDWIILGFLFSYLFYGPYVWLKQKLRRPGAAAGIMLFLVFLLFFLPFIVLFAMLVSDVNAFFGFAANIDLEATVRNVLDAFARQFSIPLDPHTLDTSARTLSTAIQTSAVEFFGDLQAGLFAFVAKIAIGIFLFGFTVFYGFVDGPRIIETLLQLIPLQRHEKTDLLVETKRITDAMFVGHMMIAFIQATLGTIGFILLGVPLAIFWGFCMLITSLIPIIGPFIVWIPVGVYLVVTPGPLDSFLIHTREAAGWGILLVVGPIVSTIDNILRPLVISKRADAHPFLVLVGALGGLLAFGFTGFIVGPLVLSLLIALLRTYRKHWTGQSDPARHPAVALAEAADLPPHEVRREPPRTKRAPAAAEK